MEGGFYGSKSDNILKRKRDMLKEEGVQFVETQPSFKYKVLKDCMYTWKR